MTLGGWAAVAQAPDAGATPVTHVPTRPHALAPLSGISASKPAPWGSVGAATPRHHPFTHRAATKAIPQDDLSANWAGLDDTATTFTGVSATWQVPTVAPSSTNLQSSTWVGVDGVSNQDLIQAGTEQDVGPGGPDYFAWYEILPAPVEEIGGVNPGDQMSVQVEQVSPGSWSISISDLTLGAKANGTLAYTGPGTSAEWIEEAPSDLQGNIAPLANFGTVQFSNMGAGGASVQASTLSPVYMENSQGQIIAYPHDATTTTFQVSYGSPTSPPPTTSSTTTLPGATTTAGPTTTIAGGRTVLRLAGPTRDQTAIVASQTSFPTGGPRALAAVLVADDDYPDALAGTPLAVAKGGPLLLTPSASLEPDVGAELTRVLPAGATVYLLGGTLALSTAVAHAVSALGFNVTRYGGATRFDTAVIIADEGLGDPSTVLEATGLDFPDALASGAAAAKLGAAVLLTIGTTASQAATNYFTAHPSTVRYAIGGPAAAADPTAHAIVGADRYQTSVMVAQMFFTAPQAIGVATGVQFPDALSGGAQIGRMRGPLLLTDPDTLSPATQAYLTANAATVTASYVYGGIGAVTTAVIDAIAAALGVNAPPS